MIKIIFGAGHYGKRAYELMIKSYHRDEILFCDNNASQIAENSLPVRVVDYEGLKRMYALHKLSIVIATIHFQEIYKQCILDGISIDGIYDLQEDKILEYKDYCKKNLSEYCNEKMIFYQSEKKKKIKANAEKFLSGALLSSCITEVAIMISNLCNYACIHKKCPASHVTDKEIMSIRQISMIVAELKRIRFNGTICFHIYNEPMNDPRLFSILKYVKAELPSVSTLVYTNGYYLNQSMCGELKCGGADILIVTGYGRREYERILNLNVDIPFEVLYGNLDDRLENYDDSKENKLENTPCFSLVSQVCIYVNGDLGLCCLDYKHDSGLGNIFEDGLINVLDSGKVHDFQSNLLRGNRNIYNLCKVCGWCR